MTRTIKASEVKPGMEVEFTHTRRMMIYESTKWGNSCRELVDDKGDGAIVDADAPVTVLSEPAPPQPEEPTEFGARVVVNGRQFVRAYNDSSPWADGKAWDWWTWDELCEMGPVTVIDAAPSWTVPADTPEVPDRIEEWPEDDTALRKHKWRDLDGRVWVYADGGWQPGNGWAIFGRPEFGPWERDSDA